MNKLLRLDFVPKSVDLGLLLLRLGVGAPLLFLHGWSKVTGFKQMSSGFMNPFHIGSVPTFALVVFAEAICSILLIFGLFTRFAALVLILNFIGAEVFVHHWDFKGGGGEPALLYLLPCIALFFAGAGAFALDGKGGGKGSSKGSSPKPPSSAKKDR